MEQIQPYHLLTGIGIALVLGILSLIFSDRPELGAAIRALFVARHASDMSSDTARDGQQVRDPVHVPVPGTSTAVRTSPAVPAVAGQRTPDEHSAACGHPDAVDGDTAWELPRISRHLSDDGLIVLLAVQRAPDGKHRFSANAIYTLVGGSRAAVLNRIKAIREPSPEPQFVQDDGTVGPASYPVTGPRHSS